MGRVSERLMREACRGFPLVILKMQQFGTLSYKIHVIGYSSISNHTLVLSVCRYRSSRVSERAPCDD